MDIDIEELEEFKVEAFEMLDESEDNLLNLEQGTDFKPNYDSLFRVFHSIKGASGMLGLLDLQKHMHHLEHLLSQVKEQSILSKELSSYLLEGVDGARSLGRHRHIPLWTGLHRQISQTLPHWWRARPDSTCLHPPPNSP